MQDQVVDAQDARLYIAVRADLPAGLQAAQAVHAAFQFCNEYPEATWPWYRQSNYLIIVAVPDVDALVDLARAAGRLEIDHVVVEEPDIETKYTAVALAPVPAARRLCSSLPLALRDHAMA